jgi:hypothetical protein
LSGMRCPRSKKHSSSEGRPSGLGCCSSAQRLKFNLTGSKKFFVSLFTTSDVLIVLKMHKSLKVL